ncbi:MAG: lipase [Acidobacteria bacterium]|nr:MAG: lipase [Acidobacteriota bacterium]
MRNRIPAGFDPVFALDVALPLAQSAYDVMQTSGVPAHLPTGYRQTGIIETRAEMLRDLRALSGSLHARMLSTMVKDSNVFGLVGNNVDSHPAVKIGFVSFRGTQTAIDWKHDLDGLYEPYGFVAGAGDVHQGFFTVYKALRDSVNAELATACQGCDRLLVTGHSLGAALALLAAPDITKNILPGRTPELLTFAGPRVGLLRFYRFFNNLIATCYRVVASGDIVPDVPLFVPPFFTYKHVGEEEKVDGGQEDPIKAHSLTLSYIPGLQKRQPRA